jgi:hypothetical protein
MPRSLAYEPKHALNAICPYFTMFPLEYPFRVLRRHIEDRTVVYDPFCGRGTTIYAARYLGLTAWGTDTSPIAVAIAKAKLAKVSTEAVLDLASQLIARQPNDIPRTSFFRRGFARNTLRQLCSLREGLLTLDGETDSSVLLRAASLGCLHGPRTKAADTAGYFSNQMPRTFSSKPDYSVRYWETRSLSAPKVNVVDVLRRKLMRLSQLADVQEVSHHQILCSNACEMATYEHLPSNISVVVTSPPYYGMNTYVQDQWLRMWFLGGPEAVEYATPNQLDHNGQEAFVEDLSRVWTNLAVSEAENLHLYIRFGSVPSKASDAKAILRASLDLSGPWKVISTRPAQDAHAGNRQADQMAPGSQAAIEYDFHVVRY